MQSMHDSMDLKLLGGFLAVVDHGSITAAAEHIRLSQPALSRQVGELERRLEIRLFDRAHTSLRLTSAGRQFIPLARDLVARAESLHRTARRIALGESPQFRIACPSATVRGVVAPFVAGTGAPIFDTKLDIADRVYAHVLNREVDFAINTMPPPVGLRSELVGSAPLWAYFAPDHPLGDRDHLTVEDLVHDPLIVLASGTGLRQVIDDALWPVRNRVTIAAEPVSSDLAIAMAASGRGICLDLLPTSFRLTRRPLLGADGARITMPLYAAWQPEHFASKEIAQLTSTLTEWMAEHHGPQPARH